MPRRFSLVEPQARWSSLILQKAETKIADRGPCSLVETGPLHHLAGRVLDSLGETKAEAKLAGRVLGSLSETNVLASTAPITGHSLVEALARWASQCRILTACPL